MKTQCFLIREVFGIAVKNDYIFYCGTSLLYRGVRMDKSWDGKFSNLKISKLAFPELYQELKDLQHKDRGDRLRFLAMLGLYSLHNLSHNKKRSASFECEQPSTGGAPSSTEGKVDKLQIKKSELKDRLLSSMGDKI